jgi:RimJ/RimL family protein N-acetyltransferase
MRDLTEIEQLPTLTRGGLRLRPWRADDAAAVAEMCDDAAVARWMPAMPSPYTVEDGAEWVGDSDRKWRELRWANFAAEDVETGRLVASAGLKVETEYTQGEIGYLVHSDRRGHGVAGACVSLLTDWGLDDLGLERIEIRADVRNVASRRTAMSAGYRFEGVVRGAMTVQDERVDDALYALLPGDPRPWRAGEEVAGRAVDGTPPSLGWPRLTDGRLVVRPFEPEDAPAVQAACDDPDVAHWIYGVPAPYTLPDAESFIADARDRLLRDERARLAVTDAVSGELLGSVSLDRFAGREAAEIGYWIRREARRRGVALGAARLLIDWAFGDLGIERLEILTYPGNEVSQALAGKLGFTRECMLRGFLAAEPGKDRGGRVVPAPDGTRPARDDQVQFARLRSDPAPG